MYSREKRFPPHGQGAMGLTAVVGLRADAICKGPPSSDTLFPGNRGNTAGGNNYERIAVSEMGRAFGHA